MADHISRFLGAAGDKDFKGMRKMTRKLQTSPLYSQKFSDSTLRSLVKLEEEFYAWYTSIGRPPPPNANDSANWFALVNKAKILNIKGVEQKCLTLRRELRNLEYVFNKRPKIRGAGPILDDSSIASLTLKIKELERKNTMLNIKIRQIKEQRNIIASRRKQ